MRGVVINMSDCLSEDRGFESHRVRKIMGVYQSEQMGLAVTQLSSDFGGLNPPTPTIIVYWCS